MRRHARLILSAGAVLLSIILLAAGVVTGGPAEVLQKAVHICLECIGIG